jgi:hypothetical protein
MKFVEALAKMKPGDIVQDVSKKYMSIQMKLTGDVEWANGNSVELDAYVINMEVEFLDRECTWQEAIQAWVDGKVVLHKNVDLGNREFNKKANDEFRANVGRFKKGQWYILGGDK